MKIKSLVYSSSELEDVLREEIEHQEDSVPTEKALDEFLSEPDLEDVDLFYIDQNTGSKSYIDQPTLITANDGTSMLTGTIIIQGVETSDQINSLVGKGLLNKIVQFINRDPRINIDVDSLITDKIDQGIVSFIVTPNTTASANRRLVIAKTHDPSKIEKVCKAFFNKFEVGKDLSDFNINAANAEVYNLLEKVAVHLNALEKRKVMKAIQKKLAEHNIRLTYIDNNIY